MKIPIYEKTQATENIDDPLYRQIAEQAGEYPLCNFHKYLLDRDGRLVGSYRSSVSPLGSKLAGRIEALL